LLVAFPVCGWTALQSSAPPPDTDMQTTGDAQAPSTVGPTVAVTAPHTSAPPVKSEKVHKLSGHLVDAGCMVNALRQIPSAAQMVSPGPLTQYYLQGMQDSQSSQAPQPNAGVPAPAATHPSGQPEEAREPSGEPETSQRELAMQAAQLHRAEMVKEKVRMCTPERPTTQFALVTSGAKLVKFDPAGNLKAQKALKASIPTPGKPVKVKVTGLLTENQDTVLVASVEINGQLESRLDGIEPVTTPVARGPGAF
jgi:hypothetical protein